MTDDLNPIELKGGHTTLDPRLDRIPEFDERSREYPIRTLLERRKPRSYTWRCDHWFDQGREGRCVEFGICHELVARPVKVAPQKIHEILQGLKIYHPAQHADPWNGCYLGQRCPIAPGPQYEGTSTLAGMKIAHDLGFFAEYRWAFTLEDSILALGYKGPLVIGVDWTEGQFNTDADGYIRVRGRVMGGHALLVIAVKIIWRDGSARRTFDDVDLDASYIVLHNSWGRDWGVNGRAKMTLRDFDTLRLARGEVCIPVLRAGR